MTIKRNVRGGVPSPYPRFIFHGLRSAQLLASIVVSVIMGYFMYNLRIENLKIPWTFILLLAVSTGTILALLVTIILYNFTYLSPIFNWQLNGGISIFWVLGFALLSWSVRTSHVIEKQCTREVWGGDAAAGVCRDYKALWAMTLCGTVSTLAALTLDVHTQRKTTRRGVYAIPEDDRDIHRLREKRDLRVRNAGYEAPREQRKFKYLGREPTFELENDTVYHNRYGSEEAHER
ncbi:hypothetical protein PZA11_004119 [Diplocarpon coronariae]|uniref:MARVEL domain-containing protein n=1 Tax=Diplocarpon coronariae TaxID=2795749 RepID=A0A218Z823_9HELO|nr:hypothetical protein B2J93_5959 [Marssonina coronariae]